jgi:hypothetical protein
VRTQPRRPGSVRAQGLETTGTQALLQKLRRASPGNEGNCLQHLAVKAKPVGQNRARVIAALRLTTHGLWPRELSFSYPFCRLAQFLTVANPPKMDGSRGASKARPAREAIRWERPLVACAVQRRRFPVGVSPTRQPLQPEAIGAVMEVTKWLKPSISVSRIGDSASVQAATRVNAEQASKRSMCRPTRLPYRGRLIRLGE